MAIASWSAIESLYGEFNINLAIFNVKWKFLKITKRSSKLAQFLLLYFLLLLLFLLLFFGQLLANQGIKAKNQLN